LPEELANAPVNKHKKLGSPPFKASLTSVLLILAVERSHAYDIEGGTTVTVPDTQSSPWNIGDILRVGDVGNGTLTIQDTGAVSATSVLLGNGSSTGTLNVNGNIGSRGVIETAYIAKGSGTASLNLNGGILRATQNEGNFLRSFAAGTVTLLSEGGHVDSNGYNITIQSVLGGAGALTKAGAGSA
jgi:T5SS/PEP-CTERM-associated repeat protein